MERCEVLAACCLEILAAWCLAVSPNPPTRVPGRSQPLFLSLSVSVSHVVKLGSAFHLERVFVFKEPILVSLTRKNLRSLFLKTDFKSEALEGVVI